MICPAHGTTFVAGCDACAAAEAFAERAAILEYCAGDVYQNRNAAERAAKGMTE